MKRGKKGDSAMVLRKTREDRWKYRGKLVLWFGLILIGSGMFRTDAFGLGWKRLEDQKYYFDSSGAMSTGWVMIEGEWYFFYPVAGELEGQLMTGWQWIDGRCYYLAEWEDAGKLPGMMYRNCLTPDGYLAGPTGAWIDEAGNEVYENGKGIVTVIQETKKTAARKGGGSSFGGGSGGNGHGRQEGEIGKDSADEENENKESIDHGNVSQPGENNTDKKQNSENGSKEQEQKNESGDNSKNQGTEAATPSEAARIQWEVRFVEKDHHENQIFRLQRGKSAEGEEISVDFPSEIVGNDGYLYNLSLIHI